MKNQQQTASCNSIENSKQASEKESSSSTSPPPKPKKLDKTHYKLCLKIIQKVNDKYGMSFDSLFGKALSPEEAQVIFDKWLVSNGLYKDRANSGCPEIEFSEDTLCSAKMITTGPKRATLAGGAKKSNFFC